MGNSANRDLSKASTAKEIIIYVIPVIDDYRKYQSHKNLAIEKLRPIFSRDSDKWKLVIDGGSFIATFKKDLGKKRRRYLKKLLLAIDGDMYKDIDFDLE